MQLEDRKGLIALLVLLSVYLGYVMFAAFGPANVRSARAFGALIAAVGSVFIALALLETFFEPGFPDWLFGGSPLATGLFGASYLSFGLSELLPESYGVYFQIAALLLVVAAGGVGIRARQRRDDQAASSFLEMLTEDRAAPRPPSRR